MRSWPALRLSFPESPAEGATEASLQDLVSADLDGADIVAIVEQPDGAWQVSFRDAECRTAVAEQLRGWHGRDGLDVSEVEVNDEDWARRSQEALRAVRIGGVIVAPPWDTAREAAGPGDVTIVIEPAMGFGSGHHATTRLCLSALQRLDLRGREVLDIGTGSGVLALAAAALGAIRALGIDIDADALENARGNAAMNGSPAAVEFRLADFREAPSLTADVVVANLTGGMLAAHAAAVRRTVAPGGTLVLSGITSGERETVLGAFEEGFSVEWSSEEDGWCCALLRRRD
jgi:ribosomal protein L11 methyltransferase